MKKVIVYGVAKIELRRKIENFMGDDYEIVGYSDGVYSHDILDGKRFVAPPELRAQEFDFILIAAESPNVHAAIKRNLLAEGIPSEKILRPTLFSPASDAGRQPDLVADIEEHYNGEQGLIFGLSYSTYGILEKELDEPFFNLSWPGMDFYYNVCFYRYMEKRGLLQNVKTAFWVIPYYYFDYDMSRTYSAYEMGAIFAARGLDDWHHYRETPGAAECVTNFRMFGDKFGRFYRMPKWKGNYLHVVRDPDGTVLLDPLWFKNYEETAEENAALLLENIQKMEARGGAPIILVPPFYLNVLNKVSKAAFEKKRERFYGILHELEKTVGKITVFDYADAFAGQRELFYEATHLNAGGAAEFTKLINREILGNGMF